MDAYLRAKVGSRSGSCCEVRATSARCPRMIHRFLRISRPRIPGAAFGGPCILPSTTNGRISRLHISSWGRALLISSILVQKSLPVALSPSPCKTGYARTGNQLFSHSWHRGARLNVRTRRGGRQPECRSSIRCGLPHCARSLEIGQNERDRDGSFGYLPGGGSGSHGEQPGIRRSQSRT